MRNKPGIDKITQHNVETIAQMEEAETNKRSFGERTADRLVMFVGSWTFLIVQSVLLLLWMGANVIGWINHWDPYPFVLLNLVLSFQAAFATPIILMSENRQARLSERRNHLDLQINLLAEQENTEQLRLLRLLCEKVGVPYDKPREQALEQPIEPEELVRQIVNTVEVHQPHSQSTLK